MRRLDTLRARFALWTAGLFFVGLSAFGVYVYTSMASGLSGAVDDSLTLVASQVIASLDIEDGRLVFSESFVNEPENVSLMARGFTVRLLDLQGRTIEGFGSALGALSAPEGIPARPSFTTLAAAPGGDRLRTYSLSLETGGQPLAIVQVAQSLHIVEDTLRQLRTALLVSVPLLVLLIAVGGTFLAGRALAPVDRITRTARRIAEGADGLSARLNLPPTGDEVGRLAETFDAMLARLEDSFRRERRFTADASHELRTPLTAMQTILSMTREKRRAPEQYEQAMADLAEETDRLRTLTENLLALASADTRPSVSHQPVDLSTLVRDVADTLRWKADAKGLDLACEVRDGLVVLGDRDDLIRLFFNLLDNAIKFTEGGGISLSAGPNEAKTALITIADSGRGISPEHLPHIFERFYRVDAARTATGTGLGLSLASEIARAHGGRIEVSSTLGEGTRIVVILPSDAGDGPDRARK